MAEKRKTKKKAQDIPIPVEEKPTKQEYAVATYLKKKCPTKKTKFLNHQVNYFYANKAVDILLDSPWATGKDILFTDRQSVVDFCNKLLKHKFFHRAKKIPITDLDLKPKDLKRKKEKEKEEKKKELEKKKEKEEKKTKIEEKENGVEGEDLKQEGEDVENDKEMKEKDEEKDKEKKKKKKSKIKLDMHLEQVFVDGTDAYVWMYDPIPFWYYIVGGLCLFGAIAVCLFPLWPPSVRKGVYYLSVAAAGFLGVILGLAVLRFIVFIIIWLLTMGVHHLWLLPNLTEDVGFFASFWPLYHYEYRGAGYEKKKKKKKKIQDKDEEKDQDEQDKRSDADDLLDSPDTAAETDKHETDVDRAAGEDQTAPSETESENSNSQAFEMVEKDDVDAAELDENEIPEKGTTVEDLQLENTTDDTKVEKSTES